MNKDTKTNTQRQAEMIERRKQKGEKRITLWTNQEIAKQAVLFSGMNQTEAITRAIELGFYAMRLIKERDPLLYLSLVDGELTNAKDKIDSSFLSEPTINTTPTTDKDILELGKQAYELKQLGFSQKDIGEKLGKDRSTISRYIKKFKEGN
jgi:DNA-binding NarL/FixJ family response regulator